MAVSSGISTNTHLSTPDNEWYETVSTDEVILFIDHNGDKKTTDSITVFANTTKLMFSLCQVDNNDAITYETDKMFVGANARLESDGTKFQAIKVYGAAGQEVKFIANLI